MKTKTGWLLAASATALFLAAPGPARAFECPGHIAKAQTMIDKVAGDLKTAMGSGQMAKGKMAMVHTLLDDAKMILAGARHNHAKPQGPYDHARAIAKADSALGYARAADLLRAKMMKM